jgi:hypothetical protein
MQSPAAPGRRGPPYGSLCIFRGSDRGSNVSSEVDLHAHIAYYACMKTMQYTIRGIPSRFDDVVRHEAKVTHQPMNVVLLKALERGLGLGKESIRYNDLDDLAGSWVKDPEFTKAMADMDKVDEALWK